MSPPSAESPVPSPAIDPKLLYAEVLDLRQALASLSTLEGWTAAGKLASGRDDLSVHRRHHKGALETECTAVQSICPLNPRP